MKHREGVPPDVREAADRGWHIHPVRPRTKLPCLSKWQESATSDLTQIEAWSREFRDCNWGAVTGSNSGFFVVDVDEPRAMRRLEDEYGPVPEGLTNVTSKGYQLIYQWPEGADIRPATSRPCPGIDIRGRGSYIVIPPSIHPSGARYHYSDPTLPILPCPAWLLNLIRHSHANAQEGPSEPALGTVAGAMIEKGGRSNRLVSLAGTMHKRGMDTGAIEQALLAENAAKCLPPLPIEKVKAIAHDIPARYPNAGSAESRVQSGYALVSLSELMARPDAPVNYLLDGRLVAGTVSVIVAKPKVGKSTLARNLALAVSRGRPFLGSPTLQGEVIYLALEERPEEIKADFKAMGAAGDEPIQIHAANAPEDALPQLIQLVRRRKPCLVVIDPLFRLARIRDEKAYAETYQALGPLIDIARESGTHILLTHHAGKSMKADAVDAPLGSTALGGIVSTLLVLKRVECYRTLQTVQRIGNDLPETVLAFDFVTRTLSLGTSKVEIERADAEKHILEYLEGTSEPQTQQQIRENVEGQTKMIRAALTSLTQSGKLQLSGTGKRGNPFLYEKWFSGSQHIPGTKEPETENPALPCVNTGEKVVPENSACASLVPDFCARPRSQNLEPLDGNCGGPLQ